jgi:hypothetical protein
MADGRADHKAPASVRGLKNWNWYWNHPYPCFRYRSSAASTKGLGYPFGSVRLFAYNKGIGHTIRAILFTFLPQPILSFPSILTVKQIYCFVMEQDSQNRAGYSSVPE